MNLHLESRHVGPICIVKCKGRIVLGTEAQALEQQVSERMAHAHTVVLHMEEVVFLDSSGLGTLVRLLRRAKSEHAELRLCCLSEPVRRALQLTHVATLFSIFASEEESITSGHRRQAQNTPAQRAGYILCVDDAVDLRAYLGALLQGAGYHALACNSLYDAKILLKAEKPNLIILGSHLHKTHPEVKQSFSALAPKVPILILEEGFSAQEASQSCDSLLQKVRGHLDAC